MLEVLFFLLSVALNASNQGVDAQTAAVPPAAAQPAPQPPALQTPAPEENDQAVEPVQTAEPAQTTEPAQPGAEDQTPTGRFTTAAEVRPILQATRGSWVAVREFQGQDLLYLTQLLSWRCGLSQLRFGVNDQPMITWKLPPCLDDSPTPNAIRPEDGQPYVALMQGTIRSVQVELTYDDLTVETASFQRAEVLTP